MSRRLLAHASAAMIVGIFQVAAVAQTVVQLPGVQVIVTDLGSADVRAQGLNRCGVQQYSIVEQSLQDSPRQLGWGQIVAALAQSPSRGPTLYTQAEAVQILTNCAGKTWQSQLVIWLGRAASVVGIVGGFKGFNASWTAGLEGVGAAAQPIGAAIAGAPPSASALFTFVQYPVTVPPQSTGLYVQDTAYGPVPFVPPGERRGKRREPRAPVVVTVQ